MTVTMSRGAVDRSELDKCVFISYRREDSSYMAAWIHDRLIGHLGANRVFLDIDSIRPGVDFLDAIDTAIRRSSALLLIIGERWDTRRNGTGKRLDDARDPVRFEIETALSNGVWIFPVLLDKAVMPQADELPASVRQIARLNAVTIRQESAREDLRWLETFVARAIGERWNDLQGPVSLPIRELEVSTAVEGKRLLDQRYHMVRQLRGTYSSYLAQAFLGPPATFHFPIRLQTDRLRTIRPAGQFATVSVPPPPQSAEAVPILETFDRFGGLKGDGLVLIGEPGSGKSTLLWELGSHLTERAAADDDHPLPVYLPLGAWTERRGALDRWMLAQLGILYQVPPNLAAQWMVEGQIMFLFDGLDEIPNADDRQSCVDEINKFNRFGRRAWVPALTACRTIEFDRLMRPLYAEAALTLLPLRPSDVLDRLRVTGAGTGGLRQAVEDDPHLRDMLRSPLLVGMLGLTYSESSAPVTPDPALPAADRHSLVVANYVGHQLDTAQRRATRDAFPEALTRRWLSILALHLRETQSSAFFLDQLEPEWLPSRAAARVVAMVPIVLWSVLFGVGQGAYRDLGRSFGFIRSIYLIEPVLLFAFIGAIAGIVMGLVAARPVAWRVATWICLGVAAQFIVKSAIGPQLPNTDSSLSNAAQLLIQSVEYIATTALLGEVAIRLVGGHMRLVGRLRWSWRISRRTIARGLAVGLLLGSVLELTNWISETRDIGRGILIGSASAIALGLLFAFSAGLNRGLQDSSIPTRIYPNDGVRRSARYGVVIGAGATVVIGAVFLVGGSAASWEFGVARAIAWGPGAGILWGFATGLGAVLQYYALRLFLWRYDLSPLHLGRWLEHLVRLRIFVRTAGGGYAFMHQLIQEHFVATPPESHTS